VSAGPGCAPGSARTLVVDASVLAVALADDGEDGQRARARLVGCRLVTPGLADLEVLAVWRRAAATGALGERRIALALADLAELPLHRVGHDLLLRRCWDLQSRLAAADAAYVAVAEALDAPLLTADPRLARDEDVPCTVELLR
jgi:predicted nucleic acid-binding protein